MRQGPDRVDQISPLRARVQFFHVKSEYVGIFLGLPR